MGSKLEFKVVQATGADADFPADELNRHSPHTRGWQSSRFCEYPQEIILELRQRSVIRQVQILSHQHKISTRIELFVGAGARGPEKSSWTRLGYLSLDSNERSDFQARELKSVYVECRGRYLKLVAHRCHINRSNLFNQVGVVAVNLLGEYAAADDEAAEFVVDGGALAQREPNEVDDLAFDMNVDPGAARQVRALLAAKEAAVAAEDYDAAKRLKAAERQLGSLGSQLAQLEVAKRRAVRDEDYDRAKLLKAEISALRRRVDDALRACDIDAIANNEPQPPSDSPLRPAASPLKRASPALSYRNTVESLDNSAGGAPPPSRQLNNRSAEFDAEPSYAPSLPSPSPPPQGRRSFDDDEDAEPPQNNPAEFEDEEEEEQETNNEEEGRVALQGVLNCDDLPAPEGLSAPSSIEPSEVQSIVDLLGEYRVHCLFSKNWALREAVIAKTRLMLEAGEFDEDENGLERLCDVLRLGISDKIAQVYLSSLNLLDALCRSSLLNTTKRQKAHQPLEPTIRVLLAKLGENQTKQREGALESLVALGHCRALGPAAVSQAAMKSLDAKKHTAHNRWRPVASRLTLLKRLVVDFGVGNNSNKLQLEPMIGFIESHNGASHTFEEVRNAARELLVAVYLRQNADSSQLEPFLEKLRPRQVEEYRTAFEKAARDNHLTPRSAAPQIDDIDDDEPESSYRSPVRRPPPSKSPRKKTPAARPSLESPGRPDVNPDDDACDAGSAASEDVDPEEEKFRDQIMKQLEDKAFSVHEAYEILQEHFGAVSQKDPVKDTVLLEWVSEIGDAATYDIGDPAGGDSEQRNKMLMQVATWLFQ